MFLKIENGKILLTDIAALEGDADVFAVFTSLEWAAYAGIKERYSLNQIVEETNFSRIESGENYQFGSIFIPATLPDEKNIQFSLFIVENRILFIDDQNFVAGKFSAILANKQRKEYTIEKFFSDFLISLVRDDLLYLEEVERQIVKLEENVLSGDVEDFNHKMLDIKKIVSKLNRYYGQLIDFGGDLIENEMDFFAKDDPYVFKLFVDRVERLQSETKALREYANQVHEVHQSEVDIRQNYIMKILTIVTAIFLPLTLLVGWYGMNFKYMPELEWTFGYLYVGLISVVILFLCLWIFKKKKFW